jgi:hypothetical protein
MANLVQIKDIYLFTTIRIDDTVTAQCDEARQLLKANGIPFNELWYNDPNIDERTPLLTALSTWHWGPGGSKGQREMTNFPIIHWTECYDDWTTAIEHSHGIVEIRNSSLLTPNSVALIVKP